MTSNNEGKNYTKYETVIVILLVLLIFTILFNCLVTGTSAKSFDTMRKDVLSFGKVVNTNANFYHNPDRVSLSEAIAEKTISQIKNPTGGGGYCDETESKAIINNGQYLVTLRCGDYLIENGSLTNIDEEKIYKVGEWQETKIEGAEKKTLFNCTDESDKEIYPEYYDELYFVYKVNQDKGTNYYFASDVTACKTVKKEFYRTKEVYK